VNVNVVEPLIPGAALVFHTLPLVDPPPLASETSVTAGDTGCVSPVPVPVTVMPAVRVPPVAFPPSVIVEPDDVQPVD
jgi:hypothetical protein